MNTRLIIVGILLILIGLVFLIGFNSTATYLNHTTSPNQLTNSIGQSEGNLFNTIGIGLIAIGIMFLLIGLIVEE